MSTAPSTRASSASSSPSPSSSSPTDLDKISESGISPMTQMPPRQDAVATKSTDGYFPQQGEPRTETLFTLPEEQEPPALPAGRMYHVQYVPPAHSRSGSARSHSRPRSEPSETSSNSSNASGVVSSPGSPIAGPSSLTQATAKPQQGSEGSGKWSRKSSAASVSFRPPYNPALPQGNPRGVRLGRSPSPQRFRHHVGFDNIHVGESTKHNTLCYTLSISHHGYHPRRRSRTMMVGLDENSYSDVALQWLLDEYADDGDEVICVHVTDKDARAVEERNYRAHADSLVERIKSKIPNNCAISIKMEYAVGKLHDTFQKLIQIYEPSMLVVGTRGRSLGGIHGLVTKSSFSKYCLQYSPIPTVVVRDHEKRQKKKEKRSNDPARHSYAAMLAATNGVHEADCESTSQFDIEARISPDEEAHRVAAALGLPAAFDPTLKPIDLDQHLGRRSRPSTPPAEELASAPAEPTNADRPSISSAATAEASVDSEDEDSGEDDEPEFEAVSGERALREAKAAKESEKQQKKKLHDMEVGEAAALKHSADKDEDEDEDDEDEDGGRKT